MRRNHRVRRERLPRPRRLAHTTGAAWVFGVLLPLAACGDSGETLSTQAQVADSAGIAIVTNPPSDAVYATVAPEPILSIGAVEGPDEELFGRIASAARDGAGNFIVADGQSGEIRVFDAGGTYLRTLGNSGEGPGEFRALAGAWPTAEGVIVAVDVRLDRITQFGPAGELLATATLKGPGEQPLISPIRLAGSDALLSRVQSLNVPTTVVQGTFSLEDALEGLANPLGNRPEFLVRHDLAGALIDTVATVPGQATQISTQDRGANMSIMMIRVPFSAAPVAAASTTGRVAVTTGRSYEFSLHSPGGTLERIVRLAEDPPVRTDAHVEAWVRGGSASGREPPDDAQVEATIRRYEEMPMPERLPAWNSLLIADGGEIWARRFAIRGGETVPRDVFGADGNYLGQVEVPANLRIQHIAEGRLTVVSTDDLGVERVEVYELQPMTSARSGGMP